MNPIAPTNAVAAKPSGPGPRPMRLESGKELPATGNSPPPLPTPQDMAKAVQQIQSFLSDSQRQLQFRLDESSGRTVMTVKNPQTGETIRQIPAEEVLKLAAAMRQQGPHFISETA